MHPLVPRFTLGIDASRASETKKTGVPLYTYCLIQELKGIVPPEIGVILYSHTPLEGALAELPANWSAKVLRWPGRKLWNQVRLAGEMLAHPPDLLLLPHHLMPLQHPGKTLVIVYDIGFERREGLYGTSDQEYITTSWIRAGIEQVLRLLTGDRYRLTEQDYHRWAMRHAVARATRLITISEFCRQEIHQVYGTREEEIDISYPGLYAEPFSRPVPEEEKRAVLARYGIRPPFLLFVGRLEQKKNVKGLVQAFAILKNRYSIPHRLVLAGMPGFGHGNIRAAERELGLSAEIVETGFVRDEDLPVLLQAATLFVFPSHYEGFGIPILQAQAAGTPLACSDIPVMRETAGCGAVFFDPDDPADMAAVIHHHLQDEAGRRICCAEGLRNAARFTWEGTARAVWASIAKVGGIAAAPPPAPAGA